MASDQEFAAKYLQDLRQAQQTGELDAATAQQLMDEQGIQAPIDPLATPPESLQANPPQVPNALAAGPLPTDVQIPTIDPALASAARNADAIQQQQMAAVGVPTSSGIPAWANGVQPEDQAPATIPDQEIAAANTAVPAAETSAQPSLKQTQAAHETTIKPVQEAIAEHRAIKVAQKDLQSEFAKQQEEYQHQQEQIQAEISKRDDFIRQKSLPEIMQGGSFGDKLAATFALLLGGISQGLSGAKTNPVMDFIDKQVEAQAQKDKLSQENRLSLKKQLIDLAQLKMQNISNQSQDMFHKQSLEQEAAKLEVEKGRIAGEQAIKAAELFGKQSAAAVSRQAESGAAITDLSVLTDEQRKRVVHRPDGSYVLARVGADQVDAFSKRRETLESGIHGAERIAALSKDFNRVTDLKKRAQIKSEIIALTGAMREPFVGPGAMTPKEYDRLIDAVGDPTALVAIPSLQLARMQQVQTKLKADLNAGFKRIGVDIPLNREDQIVKNLTDKGYSEGVVRKVLNKQK